MLLVLIIESQWTQKDLYLHLHKKTIFLINDAFSHSAVTNPAPHISSKYAIQTFLHHWITKLGPLRNLVTDRGTKYILTKIWLIFVPSLILIILHVLHFHIGLMV